MTTTPNKNEYVTRHQAMTIAQEAGKTASIEVLRYIGIDASSTAAVIEAQKDMAYLRNKRETQKDTTKRTRWAAITIIIASIGGMLLTGLEHTLKALANG